ncbi:siphovirus ReqiPepy6 Gp37-like family protein [Bacillus sp. ISL-18]|uniref:siphovirus ReqiPepy6 Gp37-like family protein n=1 Tax=Bacillus sp. ISL-18 TaxID=2819118 RepID=UPI001BE97EEA|nr:siphovirus ReqiPepy6 Gp37-like family protein [Bacillus sp. ISL-18]MBT2656612.1 siphovirus ReqiPepy6 Gp37-like family protein [Bacillus sp. ISL-18]
MGYKLYVRDQYLNRVAEIDDYQSLEMVLKYNSYGTWVLNLPTNCKAAKEIIKSKSGIVVINDGKVIFSGLATKKNRKWNANEDKLQISGVDDSIWLLRRLVYPEPNGQFTLKDYDVRTGLAESIIKQYVSFNLGSRARLERQIPNFVIEEDIGLGKKVTGNGRFETLLDLSTSLALAGGDLGFRTIQVNKSLEFQVYQPEDKTKTAIFSPLLGNLSEFEYTSEDPETNYVIVGGGGEGKARITLQNGDSASITEYGRIESFVDQRNTTDQAELTQSLNQELTEKSIKNSLSITPIETESLSFGRDYNLGDKVSIIITQPNEVVEVDTIYYFLSDYQIRKTQEKLQVIQDVVREIKLTIDQNGVSINPTIGTPESLSSQGLGIFKKMKKLTKRVSHLERS